MESVVKIALFVCCLKLVACNPYSEDVGRYLAATNDKLNVAKVEKQRQTGLNPTQPMATKDQLTKDHSQTLYPIVQNSGVNTRNIYNANQKVGANIKIPEEQYNQHNIRTNAANSQPSPYISHSDLSPDVQKLISGTKMEKRYLIVHPNKKIEHVDSLQDVMKSHTNFVMVNSVQPILTSTVKQTNIQDIVKKQESKQNIHKDIANITNKEHTAGVKSVVDYQTNDKNLKETKKKPLYTFSVSTVSPPLIKADAKGSSIKPDVLNTKTVDKKLEIKVSEIKPIEKEQNIKSKIQTTKPNPVITLTEKLGEVKQSSKAAELKQPSKATVSVSATAGVKDITPVSSSDKIVTKKSSYKDNKPQLNDTPKDILTENPHKIQKAEVDIKPPGQNDNLETKEDQAYKILEILNNLTQNQVGKPVVFQIIMPCIIDRDVHTTVYPNGTIIDEITETSWDSEDEYAEPKIFSSVQVRHVNDEITKEPA